MEASHNIIIANRAGNTTEHFKSTEGLAAWMRMNATILSEWTQLVPVENAQHVRFYVRKNQGGEERLAAIMAFVREYWGNSSVFVSDVIKAKVFGIVQDAYQVVVDIEMSSYHTVVVEFDELLEKLKAKGVAEEYQAGKDRRNGGPITEVISAHLCNKMHSLNLVTLDGKEYVPCEFIHGVHTEGDGAQISVALTKAWIAKNPAPKCNYDDYCKQYSELGRMSLEDFCKLAGFEVPVAAEPATPATPADEGKGKEKVPDSDEPEAATEVAEAVVEPVPAIAVPVPEEAEVAEVAEAAVPPSLEHVYVYRNNNNYFATLTDDSPLCNDPIETLIHIQEMSSEDAVLLTCVKVPCAQTFINEIRAKGIKHVSGIWYKFAQGSGPNIRSICVEIQDTLNA